MIRRRDEKESWRQQEKERGMNSRGNEEIIIIMHGFYVFIFILLKHLVYFSSSIESI